VRGEWLGWDWTDWVVRGLTIAGFIIGVAYGAWELGVRKGRDVERRGYGKTRMSMDDVGETFFSGMGGLIGGLLSGLAILGIVWGIDALL
jgi:hypothetical protein